MRQLKYTPSQKMSSSLDGTYSEHGLAAADILASIVVNNFNYGCFLRSNGQCQGQRACLGLVEEYIFVSLSCEALSFLHGRCSISALG